MSKNKEDIAGEDDNSALQCVHDPVLPAMVPLADRCCVYNREQIVETQKLAVEINLLSDRYNRW